MERGAKKYLHQSPEGFVRHWYYVCFPAWSCIAFAPSDRSKGISKITGWAADAKFAALAVPAPEGGELEGLDGNENDGRSFNRRSQAGGLGTLEGAGSHFVHSASRQHLSRPSHGVHAAAAGTYLSKRRSDP